MRSAAHEEMESARDEFEADEFEFEASTQGEFENGSEAETPFNEMEEMELAVELLEVTDEAELDQFLGKLLKKAGRAIGGALKNPLGQTVGGYLKGAIRRALPTAGRALGNFLAPGVGGAIGGRIASNAGHYFGLELEGLSPEDREFEVARQLVRFGGAAARQAAKMSGARGQVSGPDTSHLTRAPSDIGQMAQTARDALLVAAQKYAPGFIRAGANLVQGETGSALASTCKCGTHSKGTHNSGDWVRHGREIHLLEV